MAYFPFFINLSNQICIIIGDGAVARRKAATLEKFDGIVSIYGVGEWKYEMFEQAFLVIAATDDRELNHQIAVFCKEHHIFVNVADSKEDSNFLFPSVIQRGSLSVGISTEGKSPLVSAQIRKEIETVLPENISELTDMMGEMRNYIKNLPLSKTDKKNMFQAVYEKIKEENRKLEEEEVIAIMNRLLGDKNDNISNK